MKFKYTALGASNQKLEGVLEADSVDIAREELHKIGMSVVAINEVTTEEAAVFESQEAVDTRAQEGIVTYYFLAKDATGKEVNGTIDSRNANSAFRRLITEYQFDVFDLYPQNAVDPQAESLQPQFDEWKGQMEDEGIDLTKKAVSQTKGELDEGEKMSEEVINEIDHFIINTKGILKKHHGQYSEAFMREIEKTLGELEKVRSSNNLKHITKICNNLYELVANPDLAKNSEEDQADPEYEKDIAVLRSSGFVSNPFQFLEAHQLQKSIPGFSKLQELFSGIQKKLGGKNTEQEPNKHKIRRGSWFKKILRKWHIKKQDDSPTLATILKKFIDFIAAPSPILRRAKKQEMLKTIHAWQEARKTRRQKKTELPASQNQDGEKPIESANPKKPKKDFSPFFMEIDSFVGWLVFFYMAYFFLVSFSIERNIGFSQSFILKTISSPLIVNISILLVFAHLALTLKIKYFKSNFLGSLFLFFLVFGFYTVLMINF